MSQHEEKEKQETVPIWKKTWLEQNEWQNIVEDVWSGNRIGEGREWIHDRLGRCKTQISNWHRDKNTNNINIIEELQQTLKRIQQGSQSMYNKQEETRLNCALDEVWAKEEGYWRQRSRIQWLKSGDRNTKLFHQATVERRRKNNISRLQRSDRSWVESEVDIMKECEEYFQHIFKTKGCRGVYEQLQCVPQLVDAEINAVLTRMLDREEVKKKSSSSGWNKAPGLDDFPDIFYHRLCNVLGDDVFQSDMQCFETCTLLPGYFHTDIVLIPKLPNPISTTQFGPISKCLQNHIQRPSKSS